MGTFTPQAVKRDDGGGTNFRTMAERNVRIVENIHPQESPDPPRDGAIPCRPSKNQVVTFFADMEVSSDWRFQAINPDWHHPGASRPAGRMAPWDARVNIAPPQHVAYGSLFTQDFAGY